MEFEKSRIERLKRTLYSRNEDMVPKERRTPVQAHESPEVPHDWGTKPDFGITQYDMTKKNNSFFNKFLIISTLFFLISLGAAFFIFFGGWNMISSNNVDIKIVAPSSVSSGEALDIGVSIINENRTDLEEVELFITYPEGTQAVENGRPLSFQTVKLGTIKQAGSMDYIIRSLLFGEKDVIKTFSLRLEYRVVGSNATFSKEKTYDVVIGSSPILLNISHPPEANSGQEITLTVDVISNSSVVIKNALVLVEYPYGFTYKTSNIKPFRDNSLWNIGDLKNGDKKTLTITGVLVGQNLEDRSFRFYAGAKSDDPTKDFDTTLATSLTTIGLRKSFFDLQAKSTENNVASIGGLVPVEILWQNTLPDKVLNTQIQAVISGNAFDRSTVSPDGNGYYRSADNTIIWDKNSSSPLESILPGEEGRVSFSLSSFSNPNQVRLIKNPHINVKITMSGDRSGLEPGPVTSTADLTIKFRSNLGITAKSYRSVGPFTNTGVVPPKADKETTYTITWTITNTTSDLRDGIVTATLPISVSWKEEISPASEKISYNSDSRIITWNVGNIASGVGYSFSPREVSFKVGLVPNISQIGSIPDLTSRVSAAAWDMYAETPLAAESLPPTTRYNDPSFVLGRDVVVK